MIRISVVILLFLCSIVGAGAQVETPRGLLLYYPMNGNGEDHGPHSYGAQIFGGVSPTADLHGIPCEALYFDGSSGYLKVDDSGLFNRLDQSLTIAVWARVDPAYTGKFPWLTIVCKSDRSEEIDDSPHFRFQLTPTTVSLNSEITENSKIDLSLGKWVFWVQTYDGRMIRLYKDSQLVFSFPYSSQLQGNDNPMHIGRDVPGNEEFFHGTMDDLMIFDRVLSQRQIEKLQQQKLQERSQVNSRLSCPGSKQEYADPGRCGTSFSFDLPEVQACEPVEVKQLDGLTSGAFFPVGRNEVVLAVMENSVPTRMCSFSVEVIDTEAPMMICTSDMTQIIEQGQTLVAINFDLPEAADNCSIKTLKSVNGKVPGDFFPVGDHRMAYEATDPSGNSCTCSFLIHVVEEKRDSEVDEDSVPIAHEDQDHRKPIESNEPVRTLEGDSIQYQKDTIVLHSPDATVYFYDDLKEDGDIISVRFDQHWIMQKQELKHKRPNLSDTPHFQLKLRPNESYYLAVKAWNQGSEPPNTIAIEVVGPEGGLLHKFSLRSKPGEGAGAVFTYKP